jgi:hypothetical protein
MQQGSELWDSGRYVHIWEANASDSAGSDRGSFAGSAGGQDVSMTVDPLTGVLHGAWAYPGGQKVFNGTNTSTPVNTTQAASDPMYETDIIFNTYNSVGLTISYNFVHTGAGNHNSFYNTGGVMVYDAKAPDSGHQDTTGKAYTLGNQFDQSSPSSSNDYTYTDIFKRPRIAVYKNHVYASYYDQYRYALWFGKTIHGAGNNASNLTGTNVTADNGRIIIDGAAGYVAGTPSNDVGSWNAIDVLSDGRVVIAYYDATRDTVKLAIAANLINTVFRSADVLSGGHVYYGGSGTYVSLKIDNTDKAHLAFYNTIENTVIYASGDLKKYVPESTSTVNVVVKNIDSSTRRASSGTRTFTAGGGSFTVTIPNDYYTAGQSRTFTAVSTTTGAFHVTPTSGITFTSGSDIATTPSWFDVSLEDNSATLGYAIPTTPYNFEAMAVDTGRMAGCSWVDISLDSANQPWITYKDLSRPDYYDGAKLAIRNIDFYKKDSQDNQGITNNGWEAITIPTAHYVMDDRLSIENAPPGVPVPWKVAVGYRSNDLFRIVYYAGLPAAAPSAVP